MSVLDRSALEASPLADLHAIASELSIDGYRRLRRADLIDAILRRQEGGERPADADADATEAATDRKPGADGEPADDGEPAVRDRPAVRRRRAVRDRPAEAVAEAADGDKPADDDQPAEAVAEAAETDEEEQAPTRRRRGRRGGRGRSAARDEAEPAADAVKDEDGTDAEQQPEAVEAESATAEPEPAAHEPEPAAEEPEPAAEEPEPAAEGPEPAAEEPGPAAEEVVEGVVELLANGSGFVRVDPPDPSDDDVYISSAQVKRCELVSGDRIAGPKRAPRRSERFASLIRIETINGRPASELADSVRFDDLPAAFPSERFKLGSDDPTLKAIEWLTPFGKGSRVTIVGASRSGKTEALRRLAATLAAHDELTLSVVLAGVRPEEIPEWTTGPVPLAAAISFAASEDARTGAIEPAIDQARRLAARGADAVVLIDTLDGASSQLARKALVSARNIVGGGSLTIVATASAPVGGETTVITLDEALTSVGSFPALDLSHSGTIRPELLVGDAGAEAIARTRAQQADEAV